METDQEFLGLEPTGAPGAYRFRVRNRLARMDRRLYGGTAIAVSMCAAELTSHRPTRWMTTQFVATAPPEEEISVTVEILAPGRRTNQVRVTGCDPGGSIMFASLGATGDAKQGGLSGCFETMPGVAPPEDSSVWTTPFDGMAELQDALRQLPPREPGIGFTSVTEFRAPTVHSHPDPGPGRLCVWVRRKDGIPMTPALVAFVADMVPLSIAAATRTLAGGLSLDNSIRIGPFEPTEWVLLDLRPHLADGGYGHGSVHVWSEEGHLLATASQTASMFRFDPTAFAS
jgi:acyl-CoA thioesterase-2